MFMDITSSQNPRVKSALRLRTRRGRRQQQRILIDGIRELHAAVKSHVEIECVFVSDQQFLQPPMQAVWRNFENSRVDILRVQQRVFAKLAFGERAEGVVAVAKLPSRQLADMPFSGDGLIGVLEGVEKPGNVGAVLRSADGAGVESILVANGGTDLYNPNTIRASLGTIFSLSVCAATIDEVIAWLNRHGVRLVLARVDAAVDYTRAQYTGPTAIVLGSEAHGLSPRWGEQEHQAVRLPMCGSANSLNVSAAAAVLFYEARRQRQELVARR
jgi:TrmH family RNA methyltransferase